MATDILSPEEEAARAASLKKAKEDLFIGNPCWFEIFIANNPPLSEVDRIHSEALALNGYLVAKERNGDVETYERMFPFFVDGPSSPEFARVAKERARRSLRAGWMENVAAELKDGWIDPEYLASEEAIAAALEFVAKRARDSQPDSEVIDMLALPFPASFFESSAVMSMLRGCVGNFIRYRVQDAEKILGRLRGTAFEPSPEQIETDAKIGIHQAFCKDKPEVVDAYIRDYGMAGEMPTGEERKSAAEEYLRHNDIDGLLEYFRRFGKDGARSVDRWCLEGAIAERATVRDWEKIRTLLRALEITDRQATNRGRGPVARAVDTLVRNEAFAQAKELAGQYGIRDQEVLQAADYGIQAAVSGRHDATVTTPEEATDAARKLLLDADRVFEKFADVFSQIGPERLSQGRRETIARALARNSYKEQISSSDLLMYDAMFAETGDDEWRRQKEKAILSKLFEYNLPEFQAAVKSLEGMGVTMDDPAVEALAWVVGGGLSSMGKKKVAKFMKIHGLGADAFESPAIRPAVDERARAMLRELNFVQLDRLAKQTGTDCAERAILSARESRDFDRDRMTNGIRNGDKRSVEIAERLGLTADDFPGTLPPSFVTGTLPESLRPVVDRDAWAPSYKRLLGFQARSSRAAYDPWVTDFDPLVERLAKDGLLDREKAEDGETALEFVRQFGMSNAPLLAEIFVGLRRGKKFADLSDAQRRRLTETIGRRVERMTTEQLVNEMKLTRARLVGDLLNDTIPKSLSTELGLEMLSSMVGVSMWTRAEDSPADLIVTLSETWADPERRKSLVPPDAYFDRRDPPRSNGMDLTVREARRSPGPPETREVAARQIEELLAERADAPTSAGRFFRELRGACAIAAEDAEPTSEPLRLLFEGTSCSADIPDLDRDAIPRKATFEWMNRQIRELAARGTELSKEDWLALSILFLRSNDRDSSWAREIIGTSLEAPALTADSLERLSEALRFYVFEHFLAEDQAHHGDNPDPLPDELLRAFRSAWELETDRQDKHPILLAAQEVERLQEGTERVTYGKDTTVSLVATGAVPRVFSGDMADACYTSKHQELAEGEFPGVRSLMFVTNRGDGKERIMGSVLFVEATTPSGEKVLVVRANNPRQNLLGKVSAEDLVEQTIQAAIRVAERGGFDMVALPPDFAGQSSSNRPEVSKIYRTRFRKNRRVRLVDNADTTFNGYKVWDDKGPHGVAVVWEKKTGRIE